MELLVFAIILFCDSYSAGSGDNNSHVWEAQ